MITSNLQYL